MRVVINKLKISLPFISHFHFYQSRGGKQLAMSSPSDSGVSFVNLSAWQLENLSSPPAASSPESIRFIVEIRVNRRHQWVYNDETAGLSVMDDIMAPMKRQFFTLESCYLMGDNPHWYIYMMLSQMRVPFQHISEIIPDMISYLNHALISNSMGIPRLILSIVFSVDITKLIPYEEDEPVVELQPNDNVDDDEDDEDDEDDDEPVFYPKKSASKSSIDSLKVMTFTGEGSGSISDTALDSCRVCLEEFKVGMEVKCMPCNHLFHGDCITGWLKVRNFCPLCRHPMPSDKEETASSSSTSDMPAGRNPEV